MKNLEQIRALNALNITIEVKKDESESSAKKIPNLIINNGLLATATFALEKAKKDGEKCQGYKQVFEAVINHLADPRIALLSQKYNLEGFIKHLTEIDSCKYRMLTDEIMAYLNYLRRFAETIGAKK